MDREVQEEPPSVLAEACGSSSRHRPGQVLADLAPRAKVVQTVGCSTFTRGAKPATRRVADGERMNPRERGGAFAPMQETTGTRAMSTWRAVQAGARAPVPPCMAPVAPLFHPLTVLRGRGGIFPAPARGNPAPCDRRAISVQLTPATSGLSRSLADTTTRRSGHVKGRSRTDSQADSSRYGPGQRSVTPNSREPAGEHWYLLTRLLTRLVGTGETERDADDACQAAPQVSETRRDAGDAQDVRRMAHNPEVAGSNPAPATR
jgi:hypothetical protein